MSNTDILKLNKFYFLQADTGGGIWKYYLPGQDADKKGPDDPEAYKAGSSGPVIFYQLLQLRLLFKSYRQLLPAWLNSHLYL